MPNFNPTLPFSLEYLGEYKPTGNPSELLRTESSRDSDFLYCEEEAFNEGSVIHAYEVHDANGGSTFPDEYETVFGETITFRVATESEREVTSIRLYYKVGGFPATNRAYPAFEPGQTVETEHEWDLALNYTPPGSEIAY